MDDHAAPLDADPPLFPLVRHLSRRLTPWLLRTPLSANQVTLSGVGLALAGAALFAAGRWPIAGALCVVAAYVLDNCDGEVARARGTVSRGGALLDTFGDWITHAALFAALGIGASAARGDPWWAWLGWTAAAGTTVNSVIALAREARSAPPPTVVGDGRPPAGARWHEYLLFAFRELSRADFCFIVLALALVDALWLLLPAAAVGAQVYWLSSLLARGRNYHV